MDGKLFKDENTIEILNLEVEIEELEVKVAPAIVRNHNETLVRDTDATPDADVEKGLAGNYAC